METLHVAYYTCLNNDCPKHRNVFTEGDQQHTHCERERLWLEGQQRPPSMRLLLILAVAGAAALVAGILLARRVRDASFKPPMLREETHFEREASPSTV